MCGYIQLCSVRNLKKYSKENFSKKLFIVRSPGKFDYKKYKLIHVPELSPSLELFKKYINKWTKGIFSKSEQNLLNKYNNNNNWWDLYKTEFLNEMLDRQELMEYLSEIDKDLSLGNNVLLTCFCNDYKKCHRLIIGEFFEVKGYEVKYN